MDTATIEQVTGPVRVGANRYELTLDTEVVPALTVAPGEYLLLPDKAEALEEDAPLLTAVDYHEPVLWRADGWTVEDGGDVLLLDGPDDAEISLRLFDEDDVRLVVSRLPFSNIVVPG